MRAKHGVLAGLVLLSCLQLLKSDDHAWTLAIRARDAARIDRLLAQGQPNVNLSTEDGTSALMVAARKDDVPLIERLLERGARINAPNDRGGTAVMYAAIGGNPRTLDTLLARGANPDAVSDNGWTALMIACVKGHAGIAGTLLDLGADPDRSDVYGWTPLMRSVESGRNEVVRLLLERGLRGINARNEFGATALHFAVANDDAELVAWLLEAGADPRIEADGGITPRALADQRGYRKISEILARADTP